MTEYPTFKELLERLTAANRRQHDTPHRHPTRVYVDDEQRRARAGYTAGLIREGRLAIDSVNVSKAADNGFNILNPAELQAWGESLYNYSTGEAEVVHVGRVYEKLADTDAVKAREMLDKDVDPPVVVEQEGDVLAFLAAHGLTPIEDCDLEPEFGRPGKFEKTNIRYVFADGSVADEEFTNVWVNMSDYHEHQNSLAEAAWERHTSDFNAGDSPGW